MPRLVVLLALLGSLSSAVVISQPKDASTKAAPPVEALAQAGAGSIDTFDSMLRSFQPPAIYGAGEETHGAIDHHEVTQGFRRMFAYDYFKYWKHWSTQAGSPISLERTLR
eukprot:CAMPEP_0178438620 /NCGR_PEP_ID=MMETSP0689_2-20121128/35690_1 /TAXON_ID=160604 /ORGANISM="Amphidinium massartii, Strain CS-259" /LENGTH=110 /DNA_ID=CAMNT_0020061035 /DNA_START=9 /DNA_END=341 /DNA_ORIENTATION=-